MAETSIRIVAGFAMIGAIAVFLSHRYWKSILLRMLGAVLSGLFDLTESSVVSGVEVDKRTEVRGWSTIVGDTVSREQKVETSG